MIEGVSVRVDAFRALELPVRVRSGRAARIRVSVPWHALRSEPITLYVEGLVPELTSARLWERLTAPSLARMLAKA